MNFKKVWLIHDWEVTSYFIFSKSAKSYYKIESILYIHLNTFLLSARQDGWGAEKRWWGWRQALPTWPASPTQQPQWFQRSRGGGDCNQWPPVVAIIMNVKGWNIGQMSDQNIMDEFERMLENMNLTEEKKVRFAFFLSFMLWMGLPLCGRVKIRLTDFTVLWQTHIREGSSLTIN